MLVTYNCNWFVPELPQNPLVSNDLPIEFGIRVAGLDELLGIYWRPMRAQNDNHVLSFHLAR